MYWIRFTICLLLACALLFQVLGTDFLPNAPFEETRMPRPTKRARQIALARQARAQSKNKIDISEDDSELVSCAPDACGDTGTHSANGTLIKHGNTEFADGDDSDTSSDDSADSDWSGTSSEEYSNDTDTENEREEEKKNVTPNCTRRIYNALTRKQKRSFEYLSWEASKKVR
jgi:hypothetical protein